MTAPATNNASVSIADETMTAVLPTHSAEPKMIRLVTIPAIENPMFNMMTAYRNVQEQG